MALYTNDKRYMLLTTQHEFCTTLPREGRVLCLDVGTTTIGLALSDLGRMIATPHSTINRTKFTKDIEKLKEIISAQRVCGLIISYPLNMDGSHGPRTQSVRTFVSTMSKHVELPMLLWDERLSTMAVERMMIEADMSRARRAELVDKLAASYILQGFLDAEKQNRI
jgi:putative holliday junction resolvase